MERQQKAWPCCPIGSKKSHCWSRGCEFDPSPALDFHGDKSWKNFNGHSPPFADSRRAVVSNKRKFIHWALVNSVVRLTDCLDMTIDVDWDLKLHQTKNGYKNLHLSSFQCEMLLPVLYNKSSWVAPLLNSYIACIGILLLALFFCAVTLVVLHFICLFDLIIYVPVNNLSVISGQVFLGWTSTNQGLMCLAQGHNAVTSVRLKPTALGSCHESSTLPLSHCAPWLVVIHLIIQSWNYDLFNFELFVVDC